MELALPYQRVVSNYTFANAMFTTPKGVFGLLKNVTDY